MPTVIGTLTVNLEANTASFTADLGKAGNSLENLSDKAGEAGDSMDFSMGKARGGLMLVEESVGVHLPRHLNALIAEIPGVGEAFSTMLPIIGVVAAIAVIAKLIEKHEELEKAIRKAASEANNLAIQQDDQSRSLELTNLKLDDQIAKLEHKPSHNYMKEAMLESADAADKLAQSFSSTFQKMDAELTESTTLWSQFKDSVSSSGGTLAGLAGSIAANVIQVESIKKVQQALLDVETARRKVADAPAGSAEWKQDLINLANAYKTVETAATAATPALMNVSDQVKMASIASTAATAYKDMGREIEAAGKKAVIAGLEENPILVLKREDLAKVAAAHRKVKEEAEREAMAELEANEAFVKAMHAQLEEMNKLGEESLKGQIALDKVKLASQMEDAAHQVRLHQATIDQTVAMEKKGQAAIYQAELKTYNDEIALLDPTKEAIKIQAINNKKLELEAKYQLDLKKIDNKAEEEKVKMYQDAENKISSAIAQTAAKSIVESKNMGDAFAQLGKRMAEQALESLLVMETVEGKKKLVKAKSAASGAYTGVMDMNLPPVIAFPLAIGSAAVAFAGVMAFEQGGEVPGGGAVPILAHTGETVVTKALTDQVKNAEGKGASSTTHNTHYHIDARGADAGVELRLTRAIRESEQRSVARSVAVSSDRAARRS